MVYVTGDTHSEVIRLGKNRFREQTELTKDDFVIILGDFGLVWEKEESRYEKYWLDRLEDKAFTTLFIDGNHENFDRLCLYEVENWNGGEVQKIRPGVIHLMRGQVYNICDMKFFTFGGAQSTDKSYRKEGVSWWPQELPTREEMAIGYENLDKAEWKVDFVLSHCCASSTQSLFSHGEFKPNELTAYFEEIRGRLDYKRWYFWHYHYDREVNDREVMLYESIVRIV